MAKMRSAGSSLALKELIEIFDFFSIYRTQPYHMSDCTIFNPLPEKVEVTDGEHVFQSEYEGPTTFIAPCAKSQFTKRFSLTELANTYEPDSVKYVKLPGGFAAYYTYHGIPTEIIISVNTNAETDDRLLIRADICDSNAWIIEAWITTIKDKLYGTHYNGKRLVVTSAICEYTLQLICMLDASTSVDQDGFIDIEYATSWDECGCNSSIDLVCYNCETYSKHYSYGGYFTRDESEDEQSEQSEQSEYSDSSECYSDQSEYYSDCTEYYSECSTRSSVISFSSVYNDIPHSHEVDMDFSFVHDLIAEALYSKRFG